jgi:hypothetical protein
MSNIKRGNLESFVAMKTNAAPAPLHEVATDVVPPAAPAPAPEPAKPTAAPRKKPAPAAKEEMVLFNARVPASFRHELKLYAATIGKDMQQIVMEGVELHRQKYGKAK